MSIIEKQIDAFLTDVIEKYIKDGEIPSQAAILRDLGDYLERLSGAPVFRPLKVERFQQFDVPSWNREMGHVEFDLKTLFHELVTQSLAMMRRVGWMETVYRAQRGQLDRTLSALEDVLFTKQNAEDHFLGFSETFTDFSKIDLGESTDGVLSLAEKCLIIPPAPMGTKRIKMEDKIREYIQQVQTVEPDQKSIISSRTAADAPFNNLFHDISLVWRHDVVTREDLGAQIQVTFPIDQQTGPYKITRASLTPNSESEMLCQIYTSNDGENFTLLPLRDDWLSLNNAATEVALDFEGITVRWVRLVLRKEAADEELSQGYRYSFGLKNFSLFEASRQPQATYQTVVLTPQLGLLEKVALDVDDWIPGGCDVEYYVADPTGEFLPIAPLGRDDSSAPAAVRFGDMYEALTEFDGTGELAYTYNAIGFYKINDVALTGDYHFGMSQLYRGKGAWARETNVIEEIKSARDTFVQFTGPDQKLYTYRTTNVTGEVLVSDDETDRTVLTVPSGEPIYYDRNVKGHLVKPPYGKSIDTDPQPTYAVGEVRAIRSSYVIEDEVVAVSKNNWAELAYRHLDENTRPVVYLGTSASGPWGSVATEDKTYKLKKHQGEGDYLTGKIRLTDAAASNITHAKVTYTLRSDVTHLVTNVEPAKGAIWLAHEVDADRFIVTYRSVPSNIIRKSIVVTEKRGEEHGIVYKEGTDYSVNASDGTISRLGSSEIESGGSCYVDFQWINEKYDLETYNTWVYYDKDEPTKIGFPKPDLDKDNGEVFYLDINGGRIDLSEATETPILTRGWYRFAVESKPISDTDSAIRAILALLDRSGDPIFSGTKYFSEIRAFRAPMYQVSEPKLKFGTRKNDRGVFAIDNDGYIVVNFNPGSAEDLTTLLYNPGTGTLVEKDEHFELSRVRSSGDTPTGVRLRIVLRRNPNVDPGTTPKVFGWALRISR